MWLQRKFIDDTKGIAIWKSHHSFADGLSIFSWNLQMDETYDITKLIPFKPVPLYKRCLLRAMFPFYLPIILWESYLRRKDKNPLHPGRIKLTGDKKIALSKSFDFETVKKTSRLMGSTINELMIGVLSTAVSDLFKEMGDEQTKRMRIAVPCNIRWKYYDTYEEVKLENKIAPMALRIDLESDP